MRTDEWKLCHIYEVITEILEEIVGRDDVLRFDSYESLKLGTNRKIVLCEMVSEEYDINFQLEYYKMWEKKYSGDTEESRMNLRKIGKTELRVDELIKFIEATVRVGNEKYKCFIEDLCITGMMQALKEVISLYPEDFPELLEEMEKSVLEMSEVIKDCKDERLEKLVSNIDEIITSGKNNLEKPDFDIFKLLDDITVNLEKMERMSLENGISLKSFFI